MLVVEDEPQICRLLADGLESDGLDAVCVSTDRQAYEALRHQTTFACMIVDVNLGTGTTGFDVARFARTIDPQLPVIFVSGGTTAESVEAHGVPGGLFLEKPFDLADLLGQVHKLIGDNDD
ncbi:MAG TPA: response regulator [Phenylobacterium sp.]